MISALLQNLIKLYSFILSPLLGNNCRYAPSCSEYSKQALQQHGVNKGLWLSTKRICRCHPWGGHGFDPVPPVVDANKQHTDSPQLKQKGSY